MVLIKHNYLKSDIFFNPIFIPGFSGSRFFRVRIQVFEVAVLSNVLTCSDSSSVQKQSPGGVLQKRYSQKFLALGLRPAIFGLRPQACNFIKEETLAPEEILAPVFSCEFYEISKNAFFTEYLGWLLLSVLTFKTKMCPLLSARLLSFIKPM